MSWRKMLLGTPVIGDITKRIASFKVDRDVKRISNHFTRYLQPEIAITEESRNEAFKIRHNVYCEELSYEDVRFDGKEQDEFDQQSIVSLIKHRPSDIYTSCVRVVKSDNPEQRLPIEVFCLDAIQNHELHPSNFQRHEICEISRLAVRSGFRRRKTDKFTGSATGGISEITYSENELRCFPFIAIGLYMAAAAIAIETGTKHIFVMMEPKLARSMKFIGIKFVQLGDSIDFHGSRAPYYISPTIFLENLSPGFKSLYFAIAKDIVSQLTKLPESEK